MVEPIGQAALRGLQCVSRSEAPRTDIAVASERDLPPVFAAVDRAAESVVSFWSDTGAVVLRRPLAAAERDVLTARARALRQALVPLQQSGRDEALAAVALMFGAFPAMGRYDEETALAVAASYLWTAREQPQWAIVKAAGMVRTGKSEFRTFAPSEPEFVLLAARLTAPYARRLAETERILAATADAPAAAPKAAGEHVEAILMRHRDPQRRAAAAGEREAWLFDKARGALDRMAAEAAAANAGHARRAMADLAQRRAAAAVERVDAHGC
jgi:hypothetical protein